MKLNKNPVYKKFTNEENEESQENEENEENEKSCLFGENKKRKCIIID